jgi:hypothetical protein
MSNLLLVEGHLRRHNSSAEVMARSDCSTVPILSRGRLHAFATYSRKIHSSFREPLSEIG